MSVSLDLGVQNALRAPSMDAYKTFGSRIKSLGSASADRGMVIVSSAGSAMVLGS